jgi:VanZ family protein
MSINFVHIIQRHKHIIGTLYALFTSSILIGTLIPGSSLSEYEVFSYDKLMHLLAFMAWTLGTGICWRAYNNRRAPLKLLVVAPILFGIAIEVLQGILPTNRSPEWMDVVFDAIGTILGLLVYLLLLRIKDKKEGQNFEH